MPRRAWLSICQSSITKEADLIVTVFCPDYDKKEWCGLEWSAIYGLIKQGQEKQVMLTRFNRVEGKGLYGLAGFVELDQKSPEEAAKLILERLADNEGKPKDHYIRPAAVSASTLKTSIPHNLPTLQPFFGREEELRKIADALDPDSRTWGALIDGPPGMGKTSLAVRAAYDASPEVFKRIFFISLKTRELDDDGVRDLSGFLITGLAELFGELARELGRDEIARAVEDERPVLLLDALRGSQALLVLDNLESLLKRERDTLFTFVKKLPAGCKAILTSRGRIGSGAEELILEKLSEGAALATLDELATHNPLLAQTSEAERMVLYRETGGKPLLLRWTAGQLGRGHCLTFSDALDFIRSCPKDNDPLAFIFGDLVEDFDDDETKALCALSYFTLPAEMKHVAAIAGLTEPDTDRALRKLTVRSLAIPTDELKSFTLVPMVADFLRKAKPEVVAETGTRLEMRAYALIIENGYQMYDRFPTLEAAWPGIAPALAFFLAGDNSRLQTVCGALTDFLHFQGRWDESLALCEKAEARAEGAADFGNAGWRAYDAGFIYRLRHQADAVLACAARAAEHWDRAKTGARERAAAISLRGSGHELKQDYAAAITDYREALALARNQGAESESVAVGLNDLALAEQNSGDLDAARHHLLEALLVARAVGFAAGVANYTSNLAGLALAREDWPTAEKLAREALPLSEAIHRVELIAANYQRLAQALNRMARATEAISYARRAEEIYSQLGVAAQTQVARAVLRESEQLSHCLYIDHLELTNIRCFDSITLSMRDANDISLANVILGDNAAGKSTLLRCLAIGLCREPDATALLAGLPGAFIRDGANEGSIRVVLSRGGGPDLFSITTRITRVERTGAAGESVQQETTPKDNFPWNDIFVCGYGTSRVAGGTASYETYSPRTAVATLFDERASLWNPEVVLLRRSLDQRAEMEQRLLNVLMLDAPENRVISDDGPAMVHGPWGSHSFEALSDGYRSTSQWLLDFMAWAILANCFGGPVGVAGVLLIDELEQHLHPRWQRHVLQILRRQLPGIQIIATTHTPLIVAGSVDLVPSTIARLSTPEQGDATSVTVVDKEEIRGKRADQILASEAFGLVTSRSPGSVSDVKRYTELFNAERDPKQQDEFEILAVRMSANSLLGETAYEREVEIAVIETLEQRLKLPPSEPLEYEVKRQLRELFEGIHQQ